jgi:hypothetical protein
MQPSCFIIIYITVVDVGLGATLVLLTKHLGWGVVHSRRRLVDFTLCSLG